MGISLRSVTSTNVPGGTPKTITTPSGVVSGDVMYCISYDNSTTHATATGWTEVAYIDDGSANNVTVLRKVSSGGEPATFTLNGFFLTNIAVIALIGVSNSTPEDATAGTLSSTGSPATIPSVTTVTGNAWRIGIVNTTASQTGVNAIPAFGIDVPGFGSSGDFMVVDHQLVSTAGSTGTTTTTTTGTAGAYLSVSLAIRPATADATYSLVGVIGASLQSSSGGSLGALPWGSGESRTANNLLICTISVTGSATLPTTPTGWSIAKQVAGTSCSATIYYKIATGSDGAPTFPGITSAIISGQLSEWMGNKQSSPLDQSGSATGTSSPITATAAGANTKQTDLIMMAGADRRSTARASNDTWTSNDGTVIAGGNNNGTSSTDHYSFGYIQNPTATTAQTSVMTLSITTSITGLADVNASFLAAAAAVATVQIPTMFTVLQSVNRASNF